MKEYLLPINKTRTYSTLITECVYRGKFSVSSTTTAYDSINLIRHSITCGTATAHVTVYVILMQTTLHSHILCLYDLLYILYTNLETPFVN